MTVTTPGRPLSVTDDRALGRDAWVDHLRLVVVAGVIASHVAVIYALDVAWYYEERTASALVTTILAAVFTPGLLFAMGMLFFVAGLFAAPALDRRGPRRFAADRLRRLGIPTGLYLLAVNPALSAAGRWAMAEGGTVADDPGHTYWDDVEFGVAWFLGALLVFSLGYAAWRSRHPRGGAPARPLRRGDLVRAAVFIAGASFLVRLRFPILGGDAALAANLWEYPQMAALFALGVHAGERGWLAQGLSPRHRRTCGRAAAVGLLLAVLTGVAVATSDDPDPFLGGFHVEATLVPLVEATLALGLSLWLVDWFRRRTTRAGMLVHGLGQASFTAYLVHVPVTVLLAIVLREVGIPAELKLGLVLVFGLVSSYAIGWASGRARRAGRIL